MLKKTAFVFMCSLTMLTFTPSMGMCWRETPHYSHHYSHHHGHGFHGDDILLWGLGAILLGTAITAATMQPPPPPRPVVYVNPPSPVYTYPPYVPPGLCRWERYKLDPYGRIVVDQYDRPVMEYTIGSCSYPPN